MKRFDSKFVKLCLAEIEEHSATNKCITYENLAKAVAAKQAEAGEADAIDINDDDDLAYVSLCVRHTLVKPGTVKVVRGVGGGLILAGVEPDRTTTGRVTEEVDDATRERVYECIKGYLPKFTRGINTAMVAGRLELTSEVVAAAVAQSNEFTVVRPNGIVTREYAQELSAKAAERAAKKAAKESQPTG